MPSFTQKQGSYKEYLALQQLKQAKLRLITKNYHCRFGEIDLIMKDQQCVVYVEVRSRKHSVYGDAATSISHSKQQRLILTAQHFMQQYPIWETFDQRFDMVTFDGTYCKQGQWTKNIIWL